VSRISDLAESSMARSAGRARIFDLKVNLIEPDAEGDLTATSSVIHSGRRTVVTECRIETSGGRLVATASATFAVTRDEEN
jgi:uncharacterized protein (TIGR00369 family)